MENKPARLLASFKKVKEQVSATSVEADDTKLSKKITLQVSR